MVQFLGALVISVGLLSGCSSNSSNNSQILKEGVGSSSTQDTQQVVDQNNSNPQEQNLSKPGPFKAGEFGRIDLSEEKYDNYGQDDGAKVLDGGLLIDIRNKWERENPGQAIEADPAIVIYEFRTPARDNDHENPKFVDEVTKLVNGDKNKKIILICHTGSRSAKAAKLLSENGFTNVYDIKGGFAEWERHFKTASYSNSYQQ